MDLAESAKYAALSLPNLYFRFFVKFWFFVNFYGKRLVLIEKPIGWTFADGLHRTPLRPIAWPSSAMESHKR